MIRITDERPDEQGMARIVSWLNDARHMRYSEQRHLTHTKESQTEYIYDIGWDKQRNYRVVYCNDVLIGTVSCSIDLPNSVADAGILIAPEYSGKGHGCHVWRLFCDQLAKDGIRKIEGGCMAQNKAMIRIFERNGMRLEGTRRYHFQTGKDQYDDMVLYGKLT